MKRKGSHSVEMAKALKAWTPDADLNVLAVRCKVSPSGLYRALVRAGSIVPKAKVLTPASDSSPLPIEHPKCV